jgi:predicted ATP-grasp superfamily ATP-dependent carboligase
MRIFVYEFASGGGFAGRNVPLSLAREGLAMLRALVTDLSSMPEHEIVTTVDRRFDLDAAGVEVLEISPANRSLPDNVMASADAVWLIAPETDRCLERLAARVERRKKLLLGSGAAAIRRASDKSGLARLLRAHDLPSPETVVLRSATDIADARRAAVRLGYPVVVKPSRGAGCEGVTLVRAPGGLRRAIVRARAAGNQAPVLIQRYVKGVPASVSLLADGQRGVVLTVNRQLISGAEPFSYRGGITRFDHPLATLAAETAMRALAALPGLRGYVGVDLVLTRTEAFVIEVNPRLTTSYLGVRAAIQGNVAAMAMAACDGVLPAAVEVHRPLRFSSSGRIAPV